MMVTETSYTKCKQCLQVKLLTFWQQTRWCRQSLKTRLHKKLIGLGPWNIRNTDLKMAHAIQRIILCQADSSHCPLAPVTLPQRKNNLSSSKLKIWRSKERLWPRSKQKCQPIRYRMLSTPGEFSKKWSVASKILSWKTKFNLEPSWSIDFRELNQRTGTIFQYQFKTP